VGGPALEAAGLRVVAPMESVAMMGFAEVVAHLPAIRRARRSLQHLFEERADAVFLPIDAPGLHLGLARAAKRMGRRVVYYVCPQVWAWDYKRVRRLREDVDLVLPLFRFEEELLAREQIPARWVGHPVGGLRPDPSLSERARHSIGIGSGEILLALLPGSRKGEVRRLAGPMLDAASRLVAQSDVRIRVAVSDAGHLDEAIGRGAARAAWEAVRPIRWSGEARELLRSADFAAVASGTATLETAALGVPMVIVYRTGWLNYQIARRLVRVPQIGLANLVAGRAAAPELIQGAAEGPAIAAALARLMTDPAARESQRAAFSRLPEILGGEGASDRAAQALIDFVAAGEGA